MLSEYIAGKSKERRILLMTHLVIGYPSVAESLRLVNIMVDAGVELMELQIPFSEPIADGPIIAQANQSALAAGMNVESCFDFARQVVDKYPIPFLFMSYYNILFCRGISRFVGANGRSGLKSLL